MASVISTNRFDFLNDDDTGDAVGQVDTSASAKDKKQQQKNKKTASTTTAAARAKPTETRVKRDYPARGGRTTVSLSRNVNEGRDYETESRQARSQRGGRGGRSGRGGRDSRGREFDRHSATGRVDSEKQINQGWGPAISTFEENDKIGDDTRKPEAEGEVPEPIPEEDQGPPVKTLDEYLAERASQVKIGSDNLPKTRRANEGTDETKWKNAKQLEKGNNESVFFAGKSSYKSKGRKSGRGKVYVEIEQRFEESSYRSGRGGSRGGDGTGSRGGRGGGRGGPRRDRTGGQVSVDDQSAFPTLGA